MKFEMQENIERSARSYLLRISDAEFSSMLLSKFDRLLIDECDGSEKISDKLLALETIVRRIEDRTP